MIKQFAEHTVGTSQMEAVRLTFDPDKPLLAYNADQRQTPSDEQIAILLDRLNECTFEHCDDWTIDAQVDAEIVTVRLWLAEL